MSDEESRKNRIARDVYRILFFGPSDAELRRQSPSAHEFPRVVV